MVPGAGTPAAGEPFPDELAGLTPEQAEQLRAEWSRDLARVEDEIATLRTVLQSKVPRTCYSCPGLGPLGFWL